MEGEPQQVNERRLTAAALGISFAGLLSKIAYLVVTTHGDLSALRFPDERYYYFDTAKLFDTGGWSFLLTPRSLWTGPVNPLWIALWNFDIPAVKIANLLLLAIGGLLVFSLGKRISGARAGLIALTIYTVHVPYFVFGATILTEAPFCFLVLFSFWLCVRARGPLTMIAAGLACGLATLTRPVLQLYPLFALAVAFLAGRWRRPECWTQSRRALAWFLVASSIPVLGYMTKNALVMDRFAVANGFGAVLYLGNNLKTDGDEPVYHGMQFDTIELTTPFFHLDTEGDQRLTRAAFQSITKHPIDAAWLSLRKAFRFLFAHSTYYFFPHENLPRFLESQKAGRTLPRFLELSLATLVGVFGLFGMARSSQPTTARILAGTMVLYLIGIHMISFVTPRYALPVFPILAIYAAAPLDQLLFARRAGQGRRLANAIAACVTLLIVLGLCFHRTIGALPASVVSERYMTYFTPVSTIDPGSFALENDLDLLPEGNVRSTGADPFLVFQCEPFEAAVNQVFFVEISAQRGEVARRRTGQAQIFWSQGNGFEGDGFQEEKSARAEILLDGRPHTYMISPSSSAWWSGPVRSLRLDLVDHSPGVVYHVGRLALAR